MTVTIGKDLDNGMIALTFDSTGRIVRLSKDETVDFEQRMQFIKIEGTLCKESIAHKAIVLLQKTSNLFDIEDTDGVMDLFEMDSTKSLLQDAVANNMIEKKEEEVVSPDNPFSLYMNTNITRDKLIRAMNVSNAVKEIVDTLIGDILNLICTGHDNLSNLHSIMEKAAENVKGYYGQKVGLSDTVSREAILEYVKKKLNASRSIRGPRGLDLSSYFYSKL